MVSKNRILHCFNKNAHTYDAHAEVQKQVAEKLVQGLPSVANNILEIGCGTGIFSEKLLQHFPEASFLLTDIAPSMVYATTQRFAQYKNVRVECRDGEQINIASCFDFISSSMTLHWFINLNQSIQNILECLKSGGHFTFSMLGANSLLEWREIFGNSAITHPTPIFPCVETLKNNFPKIKIHSEVLQQTYPSLFSFLVSLKKIGAIATSDEYLMMSTGKLRRFIREFNEPLQISYEVIYGSYIKS